jgi:hypothetical protein
MLFSVQFEIFDVARLVEQSAFVIGGPRIAHQTSSSGKNISIPMNQLNCGVYFSFGLGCFFFFQDISMNRVTSLVPISTLIELTSLRVIGNKLSNFDGLDTCSRLQTLHAQVCFILLAQVYHNVFYFSFVAEKLHHIDSNTGIVTAPSFVAVIGQSDR